MTVLISIVDASFPALPCPGIKVIVAFSEEVVLIDAVVMEVDGGSITGGSEVLYDVAIDDVGEAVMKLKDVSVVVTDVGSIMGEVVGYIVILLVFGTGGSEVVSDVAIEDMVETAM